MRWHRHFALLLLAGIGSALPMAFPWLMSNLPTAGIGIALFFSQICHQSPTRSFVLAGTTLPVCARCLAIYISGFLGIAAYPALGFGWRQLRKITPFLVASLFLIMMDVGLDMAGMWTNTLFSRSLTGALFGGACGLLVSFAIQQWSLVARQKGLRSPENQTIHPSKLHP